MKTNWETHLGERLDDALRQGLDRYLRVASGKGVRLRLDGYDVVSFGSNDYLGLSSDPRVIDAAAAAVREHGAGATASPLICGHRTVHAVLERQLATLKQTDSALVFPSGYQAAVATLAALADSETTVIADRLSHASLIDGARLSGARLRVYKHNDMEDLRRLLNVEREHRCIVVAESLYSMDGDVAPVETLVELAAASDSLLLIDEAHATGVGSPGTELEFAL